MMKFPHIKVYSTDTNTAYPVTGMRFNEEELESVQFLDASGEEVTRLATDPTCHLMTGQGVHDETGQEIYSGHVVTCWLPELDEEEDRDSEWTAPVNHDGTIYVAGEEYEEVPINTLDDIVFTIVGTVYDNSDKLSNPADHVLAEPNTVWVVDR